MSWLIFIFHKRGKKLKYLKFPYLSNYLTKIKIFEDRIIQKKMINNG